MGQLVSKQAYGPHVIGRIETQGFWDSVFNQVKNFLNRLQVKYFTAA